MRFAAAVSSAIIIGCTAASGQPAVDAVQPKRKNDTNPALLYWQAIALLPNVTPASMQRIANVVEGQEAPGTPEINALLESTRKSLDRFSRAASSAIPCDWGTTFDDGPFAPMPHLPKLQLLCRLALAQCEVFFAKGRHEDALSLLLKVHRAARHAGADALLVTVIVQHSIEQQAIRLTARRVPALDASVRASHAQALRELPPLHRVREALAGEHTVSEWLRHMVLGIQHSPENEKAMLAMTQSVLESQLQNQNPAIAQEARETLKSVEEWKSLAEQARTLQARMDAASAKPWPEFQADLQQMRLDLANASPTLRNLLPTFEGTMRKQSETATLHSMLQAALKLGADLAPGILPDFRDAFAGGPIAVEKDETGITLTCRDAGRAKPLSLRIGGRL